MATYKQTDWTYPLWIGSDEGFNHHDGSSCLFCNDPIFYFGFGRKPSYCSDACKMKAYRQRLKALRIAAQNSVSSIANESQQKKSVGSASNTHTKPWYPMVNSKNHTASNTHTKVRNPVLNEQKGQV